MPQSRARSRSASGAIDVTTNSATLVGTTDTHGLPGSYRFTVTALNNGFGAESVDRPVAPVNGPQRVTAGFTGLPEDHGFLGRLIATAEGGATSYSSEFAFATAARPPVALPPPPPPAGYGCQAPKLNAYDHGQRRVSRSRSPVVISGSGAACCSAARSRPQRTGPPPA